MVAVAVSGWGDVIQLSGRLNTAGGVCRSMGNNNRMTACGAIVAMGHPIVRWANNGQHGQTAAQMVLNWRHLLEQTGGCRRPKLALSMRGGPGFASGGTGTV